MAIRHIFYGTISGAFLAAMWVVANQAVHITLSIQCTCSVLLNDSNSADFRCCKHCCLFRSELHRMFFLFYCFYLFTLLLIKFQHMFGGLFDCRKAEDALVAAKQ